MFKLCNAYAVKLGFFLIFIYVMTSERNPLIYNLKSELPYSPFPKMRECDLIFESNYY